jgi:glycosyltransferase involved in cell wall biosynthesis/ADP-heptose:LPS heptosyltransferase
MPNRHDGTSQPEVRPIFVDSEIRVFGGVAAAERLREPKDLCYLTGATASLQGATSPRPVPGVRLRLASEHCPAGAAVDPESSFAAELARLIAVHRPKHLIETGTYHGTGTTAVIARALRDGGLRDSRLVSIEVDPANTRLADKNLRDAGLREWCDLRVGLSVPRDRLPTVDQIARETVSAQPPADVFVDHEEKDRVKLYLAETDFPDAAEDLLGQALAGCDHRPDLVLLDSGGHMGFVEFQHLLSKLQGPCLVALDDVFHVKHHRSLQAMQSDRRFDVLKLGHEKFGFVIARFNPALTNAAAPNSPLTPDESIQRLLWVRTDSIGDAVLASSMLPWIQRKYPKAQIAVLCQKHVADLYLRAPGVGSIICFERQQAETEAGLSELRGELSQFAPQLILNSTYSRDRLAERLTLMIAGAKRVAIQTDLSNLSEADRATAQRQYQQIIPSPGARKLELERHRDFLLGLGVEVPTLEPVVWTAPEDEALAQAFFNAQQLDPARTIALFPGAQYDCRVYAHYAEALKGFDGFSFLIFGGAETDAAGATLAAQLPGRAFNLCGRTSLREMAALIRRCRLFVGSESAGAHIACAVGVPNVVLIGGGHFGRFMPYSALTSLVCLPLDCYGCNWRCSSPTFPCVKQILPQVVAGAVRRTLQLPSATPRVFMQTRPSLAGPAARTAPKSKVAACLAASLSAQLVELDATGEVSAEPVGPCAAPTPLVSALVSVYRAGKFIRGCLEDLVRQTLFQKGQLEIIVVDTGSPDDECAVVEEFQARHPNIVYLRTEQRETIYAAWNHGLQAARGEYLTNANTDDRHRPDGLERLAQALEQDPEIDVVYGDSLVTRNPEATWEKPEAKGVFRWPEFDLRLLFDICHLGPHPLWRRSVHDRHGRFDPTYRSAGDYEFWLRLAAAGCKMKHLPDVVGIYLENPDSVSLSDGSLSWRESEEARNRHWPTAWGKRPSTAWRSCEQPWDGDAQPEGTSRKKEWRVLLACDFFWPSVGGVELYVEDLAVRLREAGCEVEIACRQLPERRTTEHRGIRIHSFTCTDVHGFGLTPASMRAFRALVGKGGFAAVLVLTQPDNWLGQAVRELRDAHPRIVLLPSINAMNLAEWNAQQKVGAVQEILRSARQVVAVTEDGHDMDFLCESGLSPVFVPHATALDASAENFRALKQLDPNRPLLVMVGNFWPVKNHAALLRCLKDQPGDWQLAVIGHRISHLGDYHAQVLDLAAADPRVRLLGGLSREEAAAAIRDADLLLVPSQGESAGPLVVLQAMSYGTPWISTPACNAAPDEAGGIVAPLPEFPKVIQFLLGQPELRMALGRLGRAHWQQCLTWEKTLPAFLNLIQGTVEVPNLRLPRELRDATQAIRTVVARGGAPAAFPVEEPLSDPAKDEVLFSVIVPTYNRAATLQRCLEALGSQEFNLSRVEVFVCDDGSTDHTRRTVEGFKAPFPLTYLHQENSGPAAARNLGIRRARGQYLLLLNDDAILEPDALRLHQDAHRRHAGEKIAVLGRFTFPAEFTATPFGHALDNSDLLFFYNRMQGGKTYDFNYFFTCNISLLRAALAESGLFDERFHGPAGEDIELGYRLHQRGYQVLYEPRCVAWHHHQMTPEGFCHTHQVRGHAAITLMIMQPDAPWYRGHDFEHLGEALDRWKAGAPPMDEILRLLNRVNQAPGPSAPAGALAAQAEQMLPVLRFLQQYHELTGMLSNPLLPELVALRKAHRPRQGSGAAPATRPLVSVIVTCYNYGRFLGEAVESVMAQTFRDFEIVVVNDGSTDNSAEVAQQLVERHGDPCRIRLINQPNSGQPAAARNAGIAVALGELILPLDADDKIAPTFLEKTVAALQATPEAGVAYTHIQHFGTLQSVYPSGAFHAEILARDNVLPYASLYRRRLWEEAGGYRLNVRGYEDWDFWLSLAEKGVIGRLVPEPLFLYRKHSASLLGTANERRNQLLAQIRCNHPALYSPNQVEEARKILAASSCATGSSRGIEGTPPRLRITYLISNILGVSGGNQTLLRQAAELQRRGHDVTIVTYSPKPDWFEFKMRVVRVPSGQAMAGHVPPSDVVISTYFANTHELLAVQAPVKVYYAQGDQFVFADATMPDTPDNRRYKELSYASYILPGVRFVANSHNLARAVQKMTGRKPDAILPVCTDQTIFRPLPRAVPGAKCRLLVVGPDSRGSANEPLLFKGIQDIHDGLQLLAGKHSHFTTIRMSSTGPEIFARFPCEFYVAPPDHLKTTLYGTADILVYGSHYDSCPRPPQEAMAAGCAVVCTATPGAMEYCRDGENCLLVPVRAPQAIADAIERLLKDPALRERLVQGGLATASQFPREGEWNELEALLYRFIEETKPLGSRPSISTGSTSQPANPRTQGWPPVSKLGSLEEAIAQLRNKDHPAAWQRALAAIRLRPFHPEAYLLLGEIAHAAGDFARARACAERAQRMAPKWKAVKKFLKTIPGKGRPTTVNWPAPPEENRPGLTVCLITRDEEQFLARALASVREVADQIVVMDTGSTDRTVEIAKEHGAEVHSFEWCDDFSAARNAALEKARGDWVLVLDADEELTSQGRVALRSEMCAAPVMAYRLPIADAGREGEGCHYVPRLFRNAPGLCFAGRIHEHAFGSVEARRAQWGLDNRLGTARLLHHGYTAEVNKDRRKAERNLRLLERAVEESPGDANLVMNLGLELVRSGNAETGMRRYLEAFQLLSARPDAQVPLELREALLMQLSTHLLARKDHAEVVRVLSSPLARSGGLTASQHFVLGLAHLHLGQYREGAEAMKQCLASKGRPTLTPVHRDIHSAAPHHCLALCLMRSDDAPAAGQALEAGLKEHPASRPLRFEWARFQFEQGQPFEALQTLHQLVTEEAGDVAAWALGGDIALSRFEFLEFASDWTGVACQRHPHDPALRAHRAETLLLQGRVTTAAEVWRQGATPGPRDQAALVLCDLLARRPGPSLNGEEPAVSHALLQWYQRWLAAGAVGMIQQLNGSISALEKVLPTAARCLQAALREAEQP